ACPRQVEGTFFALLMSVYNAGAQISQWAGGHLYDMVGFERLVGISTVTTALTLLLVPLVHIEAIEEQARSQPETGAYPESAARAPADRGAGHRGGGGDWGPLTTSLGALADSPEVSNLLGCGLLAAGGNGSPGPHSPRLPRCPTRR